MSGEQMNECNVCIVVSNKPLIECSQCQYKSCVTCTQKYLLQSHYDAHCMNCRNHWGRKFIASYFPKSFLRCDYKNHRAKVLFEREKSLFLETMPLIDEDIRREQLCKKIAELEQKKKDIEDEIYTLRQGFRRKSTAVQSLFVRPCVAPECRGYIHEKTGECGLCHAVTCLLCNILRDVDTEHTCQDENIATWNEIRKTSKPCPSCHVRIHRVSGCNQMWCPQCHTAFHYSTGQIEKGVIHNPHYIEYVRAHGSQLLPNENNGCQNNHTQLPYLNQLIRIKKDISAEYPIWLDFHRFLAHIHHIELPRLLPFVTRDLGQHTLMLRKQFMRKQISEEYYKKRVQEQEKKLLKYREYSDIFQTLYTLGVELLRGLISKRLDAKQASKERQMLRTFFNEGMQDVSFQFHSKLIQVNQNFYFIE